MARDGRIKLQHLLPLVADRLIDQVPRMNEATCFVCMNPHASPAPNPGDIWLTVGLGGGKFDEAMWDGAGPFVTETDTTFVVTVHSPVQLDQRGHDAKFLHHASLGVLVVMDQVLQALGGWDPLNEDDEQLLVEAVIPNGWDPPERQDETLGKVNLVFSVKFDWDLTAT